MFIKCLLKKPKDRPKNLEIRPKSDKCTILFKITLVMKIKNTIQENH